MKTKTYPEIGFLRFGRHQGDIIPHTWTDQHELIFFIGQHFEETLNAQIGIHRVRVIDAVNCAAHVLCYRGEADGHIIRVSVDDIEITIPGFQDQAKLIMHLGGVVVEELLESGIAGIQEFLQKEAAFEKKLGEKK